MGHCIDFPLFFLEYGKDCHRVDDRSTGRLDFDTVDRFFPQNKQLGDLKLESTFEKNNSVTKDDCDIYISLK